MELEASPAPAPWAVVAPASRPAQQPGVAEALLAASAAPEVPSRYHPFVEPTTAETVLAEATQCNVQLSATLEPRAAALVAAAGTLSEAVSAARETLHTWCVDCLLSLHIIFKNSIAGRCSPRRRRSPRRPARGAHCRAGGPHGHGKSGLLISILDGS